MVTRKPISQTAKARAPTAPAGSEPAGERPGEDPWGALKTAWAAFGKRVPEMREAVATWSAVQADRARLAVAQTGTKLAAGLLLLIVAGAVLATAAALVVVGIAGGIAQLVGGSSWLANVLTGTVALVAFFGLLAGITRLQARRRLRRLMRRYEAGPAGLVKP